MSRKIYLIGRVSENLDELCQNRFYKAQIHLLQMGFEVINPIRNFLNSKLSFEEAKKKNMEELMNSNAAYIMPCINLESGLKNTELKIALDFNLTLINGTTDLSEETKEEKIKMN
jgi:hypothetical protein